MVLSKGGCGITNIVSFMLAALVIWACPVTSSAAWMADWNLSDNTNTDYISANSARPIGCDASDNVHVVWYQYAGGTNWDIFYRSLTDAGWSDPERLTSSAAAAAHPTLLVGEGGYLHVFWDEANGIYYKAFDGTAWGSNTRLTDLASDAAYPSACMDSAGHIHLVWCDHRDGNDEIYYKGFDGLAWGPDTRLTVDSGVSKAPAAACDDSGRVHVVWYDERSGSKEIYYKKFDGLAWSADTVLSSDPTYAIFPAIEITTDGIVHVAWTDYRDGDYEVYHKQYDGATWGPDERVTNVPGFAWNTALAADAEGNLHLVWHDNRPGNVEIYYKKYDGVSWGPDRRLTADGADSKNPAVAVGPDGDIHVVWHDERSGGVDVYWKWFVNQAVPWPHIASIDPACWPADEGVPIGNLAGNGFFRLADVRLMKAGEADLPADDIVLESSGKLTCTVSLAGAAEGYWDAVVENIDGKADTLASCLLVVAGPWGTDERLTADSSDSYTSNPNGRCVTTDVYGNTHVVWFDERDGVSEIYYKMHDGNSWSPDERLTTAAAGSMWPSIAAGPDGTIHLVWDDFRDGDYEIYYKRKDGGIWGADERLTNSAGSSRYPAVAATSSDTVYVVWQDARGAYTEIYFKMFDGTAWLPDAAITSGAFDKATPAIDVDGLDKAHIAWHEMVGSGADRICYSMFDGTAWSTGTTIAEGEVLCPSLAAGPCGHIHVVWSDIRYEYEGQYEVFHREFDGSSWGQQERLTRATGESYEASVAAGDSGMAFVVWADSRDGNNEIYYKRFNGLSWEADVRLTWNSQESRRPSTATDDAGRLHVVWWDDRDGNCEVYHKLRDPSTVSGWEDRPVPAGTALRVNVSPNPVRGPVGISFGPASTPDVSLYIYDILGRLVWRLDATVEPQGTQHIVWPGTDTSGRRVAPGVYFARAASGRRVASAKLVVLK
jgi:hypothetical protein